MSDAGAVDKALRSIRRGEDAAVVSTALAVLVVVFAAVPGGRADLVPLSAVAPEVRQSLQYAGPENFTGRVVPGYVGIDCRLRRPVALALARAHASLRARGLGLVVFDCERPPEASAAFVEWAAANDEPTLRERHHPRLTRREVMSQGFVAARSTHETGWAVDVGLLDAATGAPIDLGTPFDFFDPRSAHDSRDLPPEARAHRATLAQTLRAVGFSAYRREWWHYVWRDRPAVTPSRSPRAPSPRSTP
jgi:D-alanyl-D-alanine dipeptidase